MPKFVIDEDIPRSTSKALAQLGYEVLDIRDHGFRGAKDDQIYQFAQDNQAVLVTGDLGFGNILHFPIGSHFGIIVIHFPSEIATQEVNNQVIKRLNELTSDELKGNLVIIEPGKIRIRTS